MQYIQKSNTPPANWDSFFTTATGNRSYDYGSDSVALMRLGDAKKFLINEQHGLCAYCQSEIKIETASIEHVIPKDYNKELSTNYFNLVAVCKSPPKDPETGRLHCDKSKENKPILPIIFLSNSDVSAHQNSGYFQAYSDGTIVAKFSLKDDIKCQVEKFIEIVNLNHKTLREKRVKDHLDGLIKAYASIPMQDPNKNRFWQIQFNRILQNKSLPFRQFLLTHISPKLGRN